MSSVHSDKWKLKNGDASRNSRLFTTASGTAGQRAELDPLGSNAEYFCFPTFPDRGQWTLSYERTTIQPFPEGTLEYGRWCDVDGIPMACEQAWTFLQQSAIPEELADFQGQPGFSFENKGLGIFTATLPDIYVVHPRTPDAYPVFVPHGEKVDGLLIFVGGTKVWEAYQATQQQTRTPHGIKKGSQVAAIGHAQDQPKVDDTKFRDCVRDLFGVETRSYEVGSKFDGYYVDDSWLATVWKALFGTETRVTVQTTTDTVTPAEIIFLGAGIYSTGGIVFGLTNPSNPQHTYVVGGMGSPAFQESIWVYELGNSLGFQTGVKPKVQDSTRYGSMSEKDPNDIGGALEDCVYGGRVDQRGRVVAPSTGREIRR